MKEVTHYPSVDPDNFITDKEIAEYFWDLNTQNFVNYLHEEHKIKLDLILDQSTDINSEDAIKSLTNYEDILKYWKKYGARFKKKVNKYYLHKGEIFYMSGIPSDTIIYQIESDDIVNILNSFKYQQKLTEKTHVFIFVILFLVLLGLPYFIFNVFFENEIVDLFEILYVIFVVACIGPFIYIFRKASYYKLFKIKVKDFKNFLDLF